jgi:hypothetical protein
MASEIYITTEDLKGATVIQNNIEPKLLAPYIVIAQDIHLDSLLGTSLVTVFKADLNEVSDSIEATTQRFIDLLVYVKDAMFYCVAAEATSFLAVRITNKGINNRFSEFTAVASQEQVKDIKSQFRNYSEHYKAALKCYLEDNKSTYPEYKDEDCIEDCKKDFRYFSGFQFDRLTDTNKINKYLT